MAGKLIKAIERGEELEWRNGSYALFKLIWRNLERALPPDYAVEGEWIGPDGDSIVHQVRIFKDGELVAVLNYWHEKSFYTGVCGNHREGVIALIPLKPQGGSCGVRG